LRLGGAARRRHSNPGESPPGRLDARFAQFLEQASLNMTQHFDGVRSLTTITAFQAIANHMAAIEGRKN
jgi:hypothetical protein